MPGLAGRMSTVVKAKISRMLDKTEDPGETLDYGYQKQTELLQNVKKGIANSGHVEEAPSDAVLEARAAGREARHAGPPGALPGPR